MSITIPPKDAGSDIPDVTPPISAALSASTKADMPTTTPGVVGMAPPTGAIPAAVGHVPRASVPVHPSNVLTFTGVDREPDARAVGGTSAEVVSLTEIHAHIATF